MHDNPGIWPAFPSRRLDYDRRAILAVFPKGSPWRRCWEFVLTHDLTDSERAAFWNGANLAMGSLASGRAAVGEDSEGAGS